MTGNSSEQSSADEDPRHWIKIGMSPEQAQEQAALIKALREVAKRGAAALIAFGRRFRLKGPAAG